MIYRSTIHEIMQLAIKAEEAGEAFYRGLAARSKEKRVKEICLFLASEERDHRETFKQIDGETKKDMTERQFSMDVVALMNEGIKHLKDSGFSPSIFHKKEINVNDCLEAALHAEKETVKIYQAIQGALLQGHQIALHHVINEENIHAKTLENVIAKLSGKKIAQQPAQTASSGARNKQDGERGKTKKKESLKDFSYILVIFMGFLVMIFVMMGPKIFSTIINALISR